MGNFKNPIVLYNMKHLERFSFETFGTFSEVYMIVRVTFKSSNAQYNSCLIRLNGWKEVGQVYVSSKPIFNFPFSDSPLDLHCLPIVSC